MLDFLIFWWYNKYIKRERGKQNEKVNEKFFWSLWLVLVY